MTANISCITAYQDGGNFDGMYFAVAFWNEEIVILWGPFHAEHCQLGLSKNKTVPELQLVRAVFG